MKIKVLLTLLAALAIASTALADNNPNVWSSKTNGQTNATAKKAAATASTAKNQRSASAKPATTKAAESPKLPEPTTPPAATRRPNLVERITPLVPNTNQPTQAINGVNSGRPLPPIYVMNPTPIPNLLPDPRMIDPAKMSIYFFNCASCHGDDAKGQTRSGKQYGCKDYSTKASWKNLTQERAIKSVLEGLPDPDAKRTVMHTFKDRFVPNQAYGAVKEMQALTK